MIPVMAINNCDGLVSIDFLYLINGFLLRLFPMVIIKTFTVIIFSPIILIAPRIVYRYPIPIVIKFQFYEVFYQIVRSQIRIPDKLSEILCVICCRPLIPMDGRSYKKVWLTFHITI